MPINLNNIPASDKPASNEGQGSWFDFLNRDIQIGGNGFGDKKKERFYAELQVLLASGIDIKTALELIEEEETKKNDKVLFSSIRKSVVSGSTLPDALEKTGKFSAYEYYSLRIGEESGRMNEVLGDLASYYNKKIRQRRKVTGALTYPAVVTVVAFAAVWFMLRFVVPMFADMLKRFGNDLPGITKFIIRLSDGFGKWGPWIFLAITAAVVLMYMQRKQVWFRKWTALVLLRIPYIGAMVQRVYLERFCHAMHLLMASRTPLVHALELVQKMAGFYPIEQSVNEIRNDILKGKSLHQSMSRFSVYPRRMVSLIKVAEEVNQLDTMFARISKQYTEEIEHRAGLMSSVIEPIMIVFLGLMVAVILIAMYLPMFQLSTSFH